MKANILVVDDDKDIRGLLSEVLASNEYSVAEADSAPSVVRALNGEQVGTIITAD